MEREIAGGIQDDLDAGIDEVMTELRAMEARIDAKLESLVAALQALTN